MPELRLLYDPLSQPCRAVVMFLDANKIPYELVLAKIAEGYALIGNAFDEVDLSKNEQLAKVNPLKTIPSIDDNGFCLCESGAILRYLVAKYKVPDHWYPSKLEDRARVDECLEWTDANMRSGATGYFYNKFVGPRFMGMELNAVKVEECKGKFFKAASKFEKHFLSRGKFVAGDEISIADLKPLCELTQLWMSDIKPYEAGSRIEQWMNNCKEKLQPHFDSAHKVVNATIEQGVFKS